MVTGEGGEREGWRGREGEREKEMGGKREGEGREREGEFEWYSSQLTAIATQTFLSRCGSRSCYNYSSSH